jgi:hypothetical protein
MFQTPQKNKTKILASINFFPKNRAVNEIMWKKFDKENGQHMTKFWRKRRDLHGG